MHRIAHDVSGGLIVTLPGPDEDHNPETAAHARRRAARQPRRALRQAHRGGALRRGPDRLVPGRLVLGDQPARRRLAGGDEAGDLAQLSGRQQGRPGRAPARAAACLDDPRRRDHRQPPAGTLLRHRLHAAVGGDDRWCALRRPRHGWRADEHARCGTAYADFHRRSLRDRDAFWAEQAAADRLASSRLEQICDAQQAAVRALVRRRHDQPVPQRGRPPPGGRGPTSRR